MLNKYIKSKTIQDIFKVLTGNVLAQGLAFLATILVSRDLGPAQYGEFALIIAIFTFITQLSDFGTSTSYVKFLSFNRSAEKKILSSVIIFKISTGMLLSVIIWFGADHISAYFFNRNDYAEYFKLTAVALTFHAILTTLIAHLQGLERFKKYSLISISHHGLRFAIILFVALLSNKGRHFGYYLYAYFFAAAVIVTIIIRNLKLKPVFEWPYIKEIYKLGFWIFLSSIAVIVMMRIDVMMLQKLSNTKEVGYYSVASNVAMIFPLITMSITATLMPKMESFLQQHTVRELIIKVSKLTKYVLLVSIFLQVISPLVIGVIFGSAYKDSVPVFCILIISYMFGIIVNPISLIYYQIEKAYLLTAVNWGQLLIGYFCNLLLIPSFGANGAAASSLIIHIFSSSVIIGYLYISNGSVRGLKAI